MHPNRIMSLQRAHATADGYISRLSDRTITHKVYGTDSWETEIVIPLNEEEQRMATIMMTDRERVEISLRSGIGQLGFEGAEENFRSIKYRDGSLIVETLLTDVRTDQAERAMECIRNMIRDGVRPKIARAVFLPAAAKMSTRDIENLDIETLPFSYVTEQADGVIGIPFTDTHVYAIEDADVTHDLMREVFSERSARHALDAVRKKYDHRANGELNGKFHLSAIDVEIPQHHIFLSGEVRINGTASPMRHGQSRLLDATRTRGVRQIELFSAKPIAHNPEGARLLAEIYLAK